MRKNAGFSLLELGIVVAILAIVAAIAVPRLSSARWEASMTVAEAEMEEIRAAFAGSSSAPGLLQDMSSIPGFSPAFLRIANLLTPTNFFEFGSADAGAAGALHTAKAELGLGWDSAAQRGWRGPYIRKGGAHGGDATFPAASDRQTAGGKTWMERGFFKNLDELSLPREMVECGAAYGFPGEPTLLDPWGNPYCLQIPPPQAFTTGAGKLAVVSDEERFRYARIVSAGPDGRISTPCFFSNTNRTMTTWSAEKRRNSIFGGRPEDRGDDLVVFILRRDEWFPEYEKEGDPR